MLAQGLDARAPQEAVLRSSPWAQLQQRVCNRLRELDAPTQAAANLARDAGTSSQDPLDLIKTTAAIPTSNTNTDTGINTSNANTNMYTNINTNVNTDATTNTGTNTRTNTGTNINTNINTNTNNNINTY